MEENKLIYTIDEVWALYYKDPIYLTVSYSQFARKNDWVLVKGTQIQSLQQQNAEQAARIEMLMQSSDEKFNEKVGWYSDLKTRIAELEKQLKEAQEKG
jgi:predicted nuclease with TOPRIM domain